MKLSGKITVITLLFSAIVGAGMFLFPLPSSWHGPTVDFYLPLSLYAVVACLHTGAAVLFLSNLSAYKAQMRHAYIVISVAIVLTAVGTLQLPIINGFDGWDSFWVKSGLFALPFVLSGAAFYLGTRSFARLVGVKNILTRASVVIPMAIVLTLLTILLPHIEVDTSEMAYDASNMIVVWGGIFDLAAGLLIFRVRRHMGAHYTSAVGWLGAAAMVSAILVGIVLVDALLTASRQDALSTVIEILAVIIGLLWLRAGVAFANAKDY